MDIKWKVRNEDYLFYCTILVFGIGFLARLLFLNSYPEGGYQDEAYAAYNSYSLLTEGMDSRGYAFPVYFIAWGSGMSVLYSYLAIPFMKLFGFSYGVFRLPQALVSCLTLIALYQIVKHIWNEKMALFLTFLLAINPWHIMNSRFGLDAHLAPGIFTFAVLFMVKGIKVNSKYFMLSGLFFGLTLYCYAVVWITVPIFLVLGFVFCYRLIPKDRWLLLGVGIIGILAIPLLWFLGVNFGLLPEVKTGFFSIPALGSMRSDELSLGHIKTSLKDLIKIVLFQTDGFSFTSNTLTGCYYRFTTPFFIAGCIFQIIHGIKNRKTQSLRMESLFLIWFGSAVLTALLNSNITVIHINMIHIPVIFLGGYGIWNLAKLLKNKYFIPFFCGIFCIAFVLFASDYINSVNENSYFNRNYVEALERAEHSTDGTIGIYQTSTLKYSFLLYDLKLPYSKLQETLLYDAEDSPGWQELDAVDRYVYAETPEEIKTDVVYLIPTSAESVFIEKNFDISFINKGFLLAIHRE